MAGPSSGGAEQKGLLPRAFDHIFNDIKTADIGVRNFLVRASFLEIYNEEIRDLLSKVDVKARCDLKEHPTSGVYVKDLSAFVVKGVEEIQQVFEQGLKNRSTGATLMNLESSRSHSIFTVTVETADIVPPNGAEEGHIRVGKLNMVDLAGSERQSKTGATGERLKEATKINLSLSALGNVISALVDGASSHIPYRDSKLTRLLQDSLGGNTKTMMVANCGPADYNYEETLSTLRYAHRAKSIKNKPKINEDPKDAMIREFQDEIKALKEQLAQQQANLQRTLQTGAGEQGADGNLVIEKEVIKEVIKEVNTESLETIEQKFRAENEQAREQMELQKKQVAEAREMAEAEKGEVLRELQAKEEAVKRAEKDQQNLLQKLKYMGDKMLQGSAVIEKAMVQEKELRKFKQEEAERQEAERRAREAAQAELEAKEMILQQYESQEEQAQKLTKKLESLWQKYQKSRQEIDDVNAEFQTDKYDMMSTIRNLYKELEYKNLVLENFVPHEDQQRLLQNCVWSEDGDEWVVKLGGGGGDGIDAKRRLRVNLRRPDSAVGAPRPMSEHALRKIAANDPNPRWRHDNVLLTELEMPERQTCDYDENSPTHDPKIEKFLTLAFTDDDFESATTLGAGGSAAGAGGENAEGGGQSGQNAAQQQQQVFPQARGLVSSRGFG
ncbi:unnamed protein product [Amoebophrya sp. A120]|nr:unnamed protein product [Amoebophrya sp. A120]|eukprot:GSA120T00008386001.1